MTKYIIGILIVAFGILMVIKTEWFLRFTGKIAWAEDKLGSEGGTRLFYKLLGIIGIIIAILIMTGHIQTWIFELFN